MTDQLSGGVSLVTLAARLARAKADEDKAKRLREECEIDIVRFTRFEKSEGQETFTAADDNGHVKIVLKQNVSLNVDQEAAAIVKKSVGGALFRRCFATKFSPVTKELRDLQDKDPGTFAKLAGCLSRKPGKVSVDLKELVQADTADGGAA